MEDGGFHIKRNVYLFNELLGTRRGISNEPRNSAVYLLRQIRGGNPLQ